MQNESQPVFHPDFLIIPFQIIRDKKIQPLDSKVYALCYWYEHLKDGECWASNESLAKILYSTNTSIKNSLARLEKQGYITREYNHTHRIKIKTNVAFKFGLFRGGSSNDDGSSNKGGGHQTMTGGSSNDDHIYNIRERNILNVKSEILKKTEKKGNVKITEAQKEQLSYELEKIGCEHSLGNWIKLCGIKGFSECLREIVSVRDAPNVKNRGAMAHFFAKSLPDLVPQSSNDSTK